MRFVKPLSAIVVAALTLGAPLTVMAGEGHDMAAYGEPGNPSEVTRTVTITATEIVYDVRELQFKVGETVKFVLVNKGEQDHELVVADAAEQKEHREMMLMMAQNPGMVMEHDDKNMVTAKPGETRSFVWKFTKAGTFQFACNLPGHAEVGMLGKIDVQ